MREPNTDTSINALIALPSERLSGGQVYELKKHLLNSVSILAEADLYETAAALAKSDPHAAHELLIEQGDDPAFDPVFPVVRVCLMADIVRRMKIIEEAGEVRDLAAEVRAETCAGGPADRAREAAFRADPARFLPGAKPSQVRLIHAPGFGIVRHDGVDYPWTYAAAGMARSDYGELYAFVRDGRYSGGILVGPPGVETEVSLPEGFRFVSVSLATDSRGRA